MSSGTLKAVGSLDVSQFWPTGRSDADTTKLLLDVADDSIQFRRGDQSPFVTTKVFDDAVVRGRGRNKAIRNGRLTIRLQGIDAPELHYRPAALSSSEKKGLAEKQIEAFRDLLAEYRQFFGATATKALSDFLRGFGDKIPSRAVTRVDTPNEVFDAYGRFVGDIEIDDGAKVVNLNHWLVEGGWAFPTFYSSMSDAEIEAFIERAAKARDEKRGVWKLLSSKIDAFDFDLIEPRKNEVDVLDDDAGPMLFPKLFRCQANWAARRKAKATRLSFQDYLATASNGRPESCYETDDFLKNGVFSAIPRGFDEFVKDGKKVS
ncbi:MAG: thermonuclease family protein [Alphaproteobacteria bacterium]|nr:thermonuclease family protein [Alphaproteobacteria bacterium]MBM3624175.1 thermonuclease family protein [Alphaproteobacteria bacterium]